MRLTKEQKAKLTPLGRWLLLLQSYSAFQSFPCAGTGSALSHAT